MMGPASETRHRTGPLQRNIIGVYSRYRGGSGQCRVRYSALLGSLPSSACPLARNFQPASGPFRNKREFNITTKLKGNKLANDAFTQKVHRACVRTRDTKAT
jgi:hypothetical protein